MTNKDHSEVEVLVRGVMLELRRGRYFLLAGRHLPSRWRMFTNACNARREHDAENARVRERSRMFCLRNRRVPDCGDGQDVASTSSACHSFPSLELDSRFGFEFEVPRLFCV